MFIDFWAEIGDDSKEGNLQCVCVCVCVCV